MKSFNCNLIVAVIVTAIATSGVWAFALRHEGRGDDDREAPVTASVSPPHREEGTGVVVAPVATPTTVSSADGIVTLTYSSPLSPTTDIYDGIVHLANVDATLHTDFSTYHVPNYSQDGTIMISRDTNLTGIECNAFPEQGMKIASGFKELGGVQWEFASYSGTGMGSNYDSTSYRLFMPDNTCYDVSTLVHTSSDYNDVDQNAINASTQALASLLDQAVQTISVKIVPLK